MPTTPYNNKPTEELLQYKKMVADLQQKKLEEFDFDAIFEANTLVRNFFEKWDNQEGVKLVDRMTNVMKNLKVLVDFVKSRRVSAEMGEKELAEFQTEFKEINDMLNAFTGI
ncbi:MAG: hypothetical protein WC753_03760 [Candidatus Gracilibacteria bacterium]|jgi:hypothetical protein